MTYRASLLSLALAALLAGCGESGPVLTDMDGGVDVDAGDPVVADGGPTPDPDGGPAPDPDGGPTPDPDAGPPPPACGDETVITPTDPTAGAWATDHNLPGLGGTAPADGLALALGADGTTVYVGGMFSHAGSTPAMNVASWTPTTGWAPIGGGIDGSVDTLVADPGGTVLWAVAQMYDTYDYELLRWDGSTWSRVTTFGGVGRVFDMQIGSGGELIVAGLFDDVGGDTALANLAVYDGTTWSNLGGASPDSSVSTILVGGGETCVGGMFTSIGGTRAQNVACWNGTAWTAYDLPEAFYEVKVLARQSGALIAGGHFTLDPADNSQGGSLARWNGTAWEYIGGGVHSLEGAPGYVEGIAVIGTDIYVGGYFNAVGATIEANLYRDVARWDGTRWHDLGGAARHMGFGIIEQNVRRVIADDAGNVFFAGMFSVVGSINAGHVAMWDGSYWSNMGLTGELNAGVNGVVNALAARGDCGLYVGGDFTYAGDIVANDVARLDATGYHPLGNGLNGYVTALAVNSEGILYAGGQFTGPGFYHLAQWDGTSWSGIGNTMGGVTALAVDADDNLYVSGEFSVAGDATATNIAMYDGASWHALGDGLDGPAQAMTFDDAGNLIVVGRFENAGGVLANNVARWDGTAWSAYGDGLPGFNGMRSVTFFDGQLVVGGGFEALGDGGKGVAVWDGSSWTSLGGGLHTEYSWSSPYVNGLVPVGDVLFAFGDFTMESGGDSVRAAYWDGSAWTAMGAGFNDFVETALGTNGGVWVGGTFTKADATPSVAIAHWQFE